jgi:hypothetical protein
MSELTISAYRSSKAPLWWRGCRKLHVLRQVNRGIVCLRAWWHRAVPLWLAIGFLAFCLFVGRLIVMVGGLR